MRILGRLLLSSLLLTALAYADPAPMTASSGTPPIAQADANHAARQEAHKKLFEKLTPDQRRKMRDRLSNLYKQWQQLTPKDKVAFHITQVTAQEEWLKLNSDQRKQQAQNALILLTQP